MKRIQSTLITLLFAVILFAQNENPYSQFGYEAPVMQEKNNNNSDTILKIVNTDTSFNIGWVNVDTKNHHIFMYDNNGTLIAKDTLLSFTTTKWLSPDPANQFQSPYLAMGNNPINGVDPDGMWWYTEVATGNQVWKSGIFNNLGGLFSSKYSLNTGFIFDAGGRHFVIGDVYKLDGLNVYIPFDEVPIHGSKIVGSFLEFTAVQSPGRARMDGVLAWKDIYRNGAIATRESWDALSGSRTLRPIPAHDDWQLSNYRVRTEEGFSTNDNFGFSVDITPDPRDGRTALRIHPDGGLTGTAGCIGLTGTTPQLQVFADRIYYHLEVHGSMLLKVKY